MDWYPFYFEIYEADTLHLNPYQDGCYRRLIDFYMKTRGPLPDNDAALARIVGDTEANWVAYGRAMARPFFKAKDGLLFHSFCDKILKDQENRSKALSKSGKNGALKRWQKSAGSNGHPIATPIATLWPSDSTLTYTLREDNIINSSNIKDRGGPGGKGILKPSEVSEEVWNSFLQLRKAKKAPVTETALKGINREASKAGWTLEQALTECCTRGWIGFKAEWINNSLQPKGNHNGSNQPQLTKRQRAELALDRAEADLLTSAGYSDQNPPDAPSDPAVLRHLQHLRT